MSVASLHIIVAGGSSRVLLSSSKLEDKDASKMCKTSCPLKPTQAHIALAFRLGKLRELPTTNISDMTASHTQLLREVSLSSQFLDSHQGQRS